MILHETTYFDVFATACYTQNQSLLMPTMIWYYEILPDYILLHIATALLCSRAMMLLLAMALHETTSFGVFATACSHLLHPKSGFADVLLPQQNCYLVHRIQHLPLWVVQTGCSPGLWVWMQDRMVSCLYSKESRLTTVSWHRDRCFCCRLSNSPRLLTSCHWLLIPKIRWRCTMLDLRRMIRCNRIFR